MRRKRVHAKRKNSGLKAKKVVVASMMTAGYDESKTESERWNANNHATSGKETSTKEPRALLKRIHTRSKKRKTRGTGNARIGGMSGEKRHKQRVSRSPRSAIRGRTNPSGGEKD